ncbi:MAG TPA: hypothetical protein PKL35_08025 [Methanoregulaceae archaeon]|nr:hypothetical protein [Methanoregulaceae archaeon]
MTSAQSPSETTHSLLPKACLGICGADFSPPSLVAIAQLRMIMWRKKESPYNAVRYPPGI